MRAIVFSLLLMNVGVFAYFQFVNPSVAVASPADIAAPSDARQDLEFLSDRQLSDSQQSASALEVSQSAPAVCSLVGPFTRLLAAEYFVERLSALKVLSEIKDLTVSGEAGYWLHLPPLVSRKEALRLLRELQQKSVDSYVIPSGDLANGISLGMFSDRSRALDMQNTVKQLGYSPQVLEVNRDQKEVWLYLPQGEAAKLTNNRWVELLSAEEFLQKRQILCSDVASGANFQ